MLAFIFRALKHFRPVFSRKSTWLIFCLVILGFLGSPEVIGVSSFCRFWGFGDAAYNSILHFFRSTGWSLSMLIAYWGSFVLSQNLTVTINGRAVLLGDHTAVPKDGCRMPGVVSLRQQSETQSKPSYFRGHCFGAIGLLIGSLYSPFCLPIALGLHQGFLHIGEDKKKKSTRQTMGTRMVDMAINFAVRHNIPSILVPDAFFPTGAVFKLAASVLCQELQQPMVTLIVRAKKNFVACFEAERPEKRGPGRPAVYGTKVKLTEMFDWKHLFSTVTCPIYGKMEEVSIMSADLLWRPAGSLIRFVFAVTSRGQIILMCSDLTMSPVDVLELYCSRIRVEIMFDMLKNLIGAFCYRFWTKKLPKSSRKPLKNKKLKKPAAESINTVRSCWEACERFVMLGVIALGLLELIALKFSSTIWEHYDGYLRTRSRDLPSERTVKYVIAPLLASNIRGLAPDGILQKILNRFCRGKSPSSG